MFDRGIFSERLIKLRTNNNTMAKDLAFNIGISKQAISQYEKQQSTPSADILTAIAEYFNVSLDYLLGKTDSPSIIIDNKNNSDEQNITNEEAELLEDFRLLDKYEKNIIMGKISEMIYNKSVEESNLEVENSDELVNIALRDR